MKLDTKNELKLYKESSQYTECADMAFQHGLGKMYTNFQKEIECKIELMQNEFERCGSWRDSVIIAGKIEVLQELLTD